MSQHLINQREHLLDTPQVPLAVLLALRHLGDHLLEIHADHGIGRDQLLELDYHRMQLGRLRSRLHSAPQPGEPFLKRVLVGRQPASHPVPHDRANPHSVLVAVAHPALPP